jgi:transformation/transcription domain-associated protein
MLEDDVSYISLHQIYEDFCTRSGVHKDAAIDFFGNSVEQAISMKTVNKSNYVANFQEKDGKEWLNNVRMEIIKAIRQTIVPDTLLLDVKLCRSAKLIEKFFKRTFSTFPDLWLFRKQFTLQYAAIAFQTYLLAINNRYPQRLYFSRAKGNVWSAEMLPGITHT